MSTIVARFETEAELGAAEQGWWYDSADLSIVELADSDELELTFAYSPANLDLLFPSSSAGADMDR